MQTGNTMLQILGSFLPATAVLAILLFAVKEVLELCRRRSGDRRKVAALKHLLARDMELNASAIASYRGLMDDCQRVLDEPGREIAIKTSNGGRLHYEHWMPGEARTSGGGIRPVAKEASSRFILEVSVLDRKLYADLEKAIDALSELEHIKSSFLEYINDKELLSGFLEYAEEVLNEIELDLSKLYKSCTGKDKIKSRLR